MAPQRSLRSRPRRGAANYEAGAFDEDAQSKKRKRDEVNRQRQAVVFVLKEKAAGHDHHGLITAAARKYNLYNQFGEPKTQLITYHLNEQLKADPGVIDRLKAVADMSAEKEKEQEKKKQRRRRGASTPTIMSQPKQTPTYMEAYKAGGEAVRSGTMSSREAARAAQKKGVSISHTTMAKAAREPGSPNKVGAPTKIPYDVELALFQLVVYMALINFPFTMGEIMIMATYSIAGTSVAKKFKKGIVTYRWYKSFIDRWGPIGIFSYIDKKSH